MTRDEILALPAGPELDALVAEKVMGWRITIGNTSHKGRVIAWPDPDHSGICFEPSTDIAAAWLVTELLHLTVYCPEASFADGEYRNGKEYRAETRDGKYGSAESAPLAICRAALLLDLALTKPGE